MRLALITEEEEGEEEEEEKQGTFEEQKVM